MHIFACIYIYMAFACVYMCLPILCACVYMYLYVCIFVHVPTCLFICMYVYGCLLILLQWFHSVCPFDHDFLQCDESLEWASAREATWRQHMYLLCHVINPRKIVLRKTYASHWAQIWTRRTLLHVYISYRSSACCRCLPMITRAILYTVQIQLSGKFSCITTSIFLFISSTAAETGLSLVP